jgi:hypothetical protein
LTRKQIALVTLVVLVASAVSAVLAYRRALRQASVRELPSEPAGGCVDFRDAGSHVGKFGCISGRVLRVYTSRSGNTFLDFCADYRHCPFTSVIFQSDSDKFGNLQTLTAHEIEIRGDITLYQSRAEIIIRDTQQIRARP